jgi:hypothetical protein
MTELSREELTIQLDRRRSRFRPQASACQLSAARLQLDRSSHWFASESTTQIGVLITQHLRGFRHDMEGSSMTEPGRLAGSDGGGRRRGPTCAICEVCARRERRARARRAHRPPSAGRSPRPSASQVLRLTSTRWIGRRSHVRLPHAVARAVERSSAPPTAIVAPMALASLPRCAVDVPSTRGRLRSSMSYVPSASGQLPLRRRRSHVNDVKPQQLCGSDEASGQLPLRRRRSHVNDVKPQQLCGSDEASAQEGRRPRAGDRVAPPPPRA